MARATWVVGADAMPARRRASSCSRTSDAQTPTARASARQSPAGTESRRSATSSPISSVMAPSACRACSAVGCTRIVSVHAWPGAVAAPSALWRSSSTRSALLQDARLSTTMCGGSATSTFFPPDDGQPPSYPSSKQRRAAKGGGRVTTLAGAPLWRPLARLHENRAAWRKAAAARIAPTPGRTSRRTLAPAPDRRHCGDRR